MKAEEKLEMARSSLIRSAPFYAVQAMKLPFIPDKSWHTMCTNGIVVKYNPDWVADSNTSLGRVEVTTVHEIMHINFKDHLRKGNRDFDRWNRATDYRINSILKRSGYDVNGMLYDSRFEGMDAPQIYWILEQEETQTAEETQNEKSEDQQSNNMGCSGDSQDQEGEGDSSKDLEDGDSNGEDELSEEGSQNQSSSSSTEDDSSNNSSGESESNGETSSLSGSHCDSKKDPEEGTQGRVFSSSSGEAEQDSLVPSLPGQISSCIGEVEDFPGESGIPTEQEINQQEAEIKIGMEQAFRIAMKAGNMPAGMKILIEQLMKPEVDWKEFLSGWVNERSSSDYTMTRPNRRYLHSGFSLPSLYDKELNNLVVMVDCSGSVTERPQMVRKFITEVISLATNFNIKKITILYIDYSICGIDILEEESQEPDLSKLSGGGGTSFRPGFNWIEKKIEEGEELPVGVIYLTDGECSSFSEEPLFPVLWVTTKSNYFSEFKPPFGDVITLNDW